MRLILITIAILTLLYGVESQVGYIDQPSVNSFSLVIDRSGSMNGNPIEDAKKAAIHFIDEMRVGDQANIIAFDDRVSVYADLGDSKSKLKSAVSNINSGGSTAFHDAIAKASTLLYNEIGARIIVFLTDGDDTGSKFSLRDIKNMNLSEGIFVYGIGLGNVNNNALNELINATGGTYYSASNSSELYTLYDRALNAYYKDFGNKLSAKASMTIRSIPSSQTIIVDGESIGKTPVKLDGLSPKNYDIQIQFSKGTWQSTIIAKKGQRAIINARESELGYNLFVSSKPKAATVFLDGDYIGITSFGVTDYNIKKRFFKEDIKTKSYEEELMIPLLPKGEHIIRVLMVPEDDEPDMNLEYEFAFTIKDQDRFLDINLFKNTHQFQDGEKGKQIKDPFKELNEIQFEDDISE